MEIAPAHSAAAEDVAASLQQYKGETWAPLGWL